MKKKKGRKKGSTYRKIARPKIRVAPDSVLTTVCTEISLEEIPENIEHIIRDMMNIVTNNKQAAGLAANQVGYDRRIILIKDKVDDWLVMINPKIVEVGEKKKLLREGCLSYPGRIKPVSRYTEIEVKYWTINPQEKVEFWSNETFTDTQVRVIQHEIDHLDGQCKIGMGDF